MRVAGTYDKTINLEKDTLRTGLKMYGARIHTVKLQDLPYEPDTILSKEQKKQIKEYCINDVDLTKNLYDKVLPAIKLREVLNTKYNGNRTYKLDFRSDGDATIADKLFGNKDKSQTDYDFYYKTPDYIKPKSIVISDLIQKVESYNFKGKHGDKFDLEQIEVDLQSEHKYTFRVGGLHSTEKNVNYKTDDKHYISYLDVSSYYPSIILNNNLYPKKIGKEFLEQYKDIYEERLHAKREGNKQISNTHKIILNGCFGKFKDKFSSLYDPETFIKITLTGQLSLLMLIENLEMQGFSVISANTDGLVVLVGSKGIDSYKKIIKEWQKTTGLVLEELKLNAIYIDSVNHYIAFDEDNNVITKGHYNFADLNRNPSYQICKKAIINYLKENIPIEQTVKDFKDIRDYIIVKKATTGAYWKNEYLGKVVRWYWSIEGEPIVNKKGDRVSRSEGAVPIMDLSDNVNKSNIDYQKYIDESYKMLSNFRS